MESSVKFLRPVTPEIVRSVPAAAAPSANGMALSLDDVYYTLFRHKWKIILCSLVGIAAAAGWIAFRKPPYISEAKLFVRYVVVEGMSMRPTNDDIVTKSPDMRGETIMSSEQEIITSLDLSRQVAQIIGPEKILPKYKGDNALDAAAVTINRGLIADSPKFSSIINLRFQHPDPELVQPVLREVIVQYFKKHVEIHRSSGMVGDFLTQETDQLRTRLAQTEEELRTAKNKAGVLSVEDAKKSYAEQRVSIRQQIFAAQAELAERNAIIQALSKTPSATAVPPTGAATKDVEEKAPAQGAAVQDLSPVLVDQYRVALGRVEFLRKREQELLQQLTPENIRVKEVQAQLADAIASTGKMESENPRLLRERAMNLAASTEKSSSGSGFDLAAEMTRVAALQAKIKTLNDQLETLRSEVSNFELMEGNIQELMRKKELEEVNYRHYAASLEQSRINEALGSGRVSNISQIQTPSPPRFDTKKAFQIPGGLAVGGIAIGLAWAFLIELVLDRSVRRSTDIEKKLKLPLFISIPDLSHKPRGRIASLLRRKAPRGPKVPGRANGSASTDGSASEHPAPLAADLTLSSPPPALHPFHETLRDRLIGYFESRNLTHRPKLVAVTGLNIGSGVTTTATGLAKALSDTGDGNVLLVDLAPGHGSAQHFHKGRHICGIDEILSTRDSALVQDNLYVVAENSNGDPLSGILPQRFKQLVPKLKASNFDYIIFDMPPVSQISITPRVAGLMDVVLMVIESEKTDMELVVQANALLSTSKAYVGTVLNKETFHLPSRLHKEYQGHI